MLSQKSRSINRNFYFIGQDRAKHKGIGLSDNSLTFIFGNCSLLPSIVLLAASGQPEAIILLKFL